LGNRYAYATLHGMNNPRRPGTMSRIAAIALVLGWAPLAHGKSCTSRDQTGADAMIDELDSWAKVTILYTKYRQCDEGYFAEGYSEGIARLLVDRWDTLPDLDAAVKRRPRLKQFVLRHINATLNGDDLDKIEALSTTSCPPSLTPLCRDLAHAAAHAGD